MVTHNDAIKNMADRVIKKFLFFEVNFIFDVNVHNML